MIAVDCDGFEQGILYIIFVNSVWSHFLSWEYETLVVEYFNGLLIRNFLKSWKQLFSFEFYH